MLRALGAVAGGGHDQAVAVDGSKRRGFAGIETEGPRRFERRAQEGRKHRIVGVEAREQGLEAGRAHAAAAARPRASAWRAASSCSSSRAIGG
jgi:hypothetical protein